MINKLSLRITRKLLSNGTIPKEDEELYVYGYFMLLSHLMYLILTIVAGLIIGCFLESIVFYFAFQFLRKFAGGYHASTEGRCEIMSFLSILICLVSIKMFEMVNVPGVLFIASTISAICIFAVCPLDTPEKPLSDKELKHYRKISWIVLLVIYIAITISLVFDFDILFVPCCISLILESLLLIAGKFKKISRKNA